MCTVYTPVYYTINPSMDANLKDALKALLDIYEHG